MTDQQLADFVEGAGTHLGRGGDAVAARGDVVDERLSRDVVRPLHLMRRDIGERLRQIDRRVIAVMFKADDPAEVLDPTRSFVAGVPQHSQPSAGPQHPGDLGHGPLLIEPVPGLGHQHRVNGVVGQGNLLCGTE